MIVSYETLRTLQDELAGHPIGLLLADEGHRLKNAGAFGHKRERHKLIQDTLTFQALTALNVQRRVILTGTPIQNDLSEYFALLNFANPEYLGSKLDFKKNFESKILRGRDADATEKEKEESDAKLKELGGQVNKFIIRRTNDLLSKYCELLESSNDWRAHVSARQVRTCRFLPTEQIASGSLRHLCHLQGCAAAFAWQGLAAAQGDWSAPKARQSPGSTQPSGGFAGERERPAGRLSGQGSGSYRQLLVFGQICRA